MIVTEKHVFFYTNYLSNFWKSNFVWEAFSEKHSFFCTEQAFMWAKAMYFNDKDTAKKILNENDPMRCKHLGRLVKNYDDYKWSLVRASFMFEVNLCKYNQNPELKTLITDKMFDGKTFVEASPTDRIWGIGRSLSYENIDDESTWKGTNLLGKTLTEVRDVILHDMEEAGIGRS